MIMERNLENSMSKIMEQPGVIGAVCVDKRGLCVSAKGVGEGEMSGVLCSIADQARKLEPTSPTNPIVRLESDQGYCLVQKGNDFTLAIFKESN